MNAMQRYKQKCLLRQGIIEQETGEQTALSDDFAEDLAALKAIASISDKVAYKRDVLLPKYNDEIKAYIDSGSTEPFEKLCYGMIWSFDIGDIEQAFSYLGSVLATNQEMPSIIKSTPEVFAMGAFYDWAKEQVAQGHSADPYLSDLYDEIVNADEATLPDALVNNFHKLVGDVAVEAEDYEKALAAFTAAQELLGEKAGVKTRLDKVKAKLEV